MTPTLVTWIGGISLYDYDGRVDRCILYVCLHDSVYVCIHYFNDLFIFSMWFMLINKILHQLAWKRWHQKSSDNINCRNHQEWVSMLHMEFAASQCLLEFHYPLAWWDWNTPNINMREYSRYITYGKPHNLALVTAWGPSSTTYKTIAQLWDWELPLGEGSPFLAAIFIWVLYTAM